MVEIRCRIIAEPQGETRPIYKTDDKSNSIPGPFIRGKFGGELDYVCGNCAYLLAQNVSRDEIPTDVVFQCPRCGSFNEV
jgi:DNA-directed RNA polymerase subunit RPC12/RpoP